MRFVLAVRAAGACLAFAPTLAVNADIPFYDIFKSYYYEQQSADTPPASPYSHQLAARVFFTDNGDLDSADVLFAGPASPLELETFPGVAAAAGPPYPSEEALEGNFPPGAYSFAITGGNFDGTSLSLSLPASLFCEAVPYFTGDTYDRLQAVDTALDFEGTINGFAAPPGASEAFTFLAVYDQFGNVVWDADFVDTGGTTFTIPAGTLDPAGTDYIISIFYSSRVVSDGTVEDSLAIAGFDRVTQAPLTVIPVPVGCNVADITEIGGVAEAPGNPDQQLTVDDIIVFINLFSDGTGCPGPNPPSGPACSRSDVTGIGGPPELPDGQLTVDDIIAFFNAFSDGCA